MKYLSLFLLTVSALGQNLFPGPGSPLQLDTTRLYPQIQVVWTNADGTVQPSLPLIAVVINSTNGISVIDPQGGGAQIILKQGDISLASTNPAAGGQPEMDAAAYIGGSGKNVFYLVSGLDGGYGDTLGFDPSGDAGIAAPILLGTSYSNVIASASILAAIHNAHTNVVTIYGSGIEAVGGLIVTNSFLSATNKWSGPTNTVDMSIYRQSYQTVVPVQFSGYIHSSNSLGAEVQLSIYNNSSSNITATYGQGVTDRDFNSQVTITNGNKGIFWMQVDPALKKGTNIVFNQF